MRRGTINEIEPTVYEINLLEDTVEKVYVSPRFYPFSDTLARADIAVLRQDLNLLTNNPTSEVDSVSELITWYGNLKNLSVTHIEHDSSAFGDNHPVFTPSADNVSFNFDCFTLGTGTSANPTQHQVNLPVASATLAGIITSEGGAFFDENTTGKIDTYDDLKDFFDDTTPEGYNYTKNTTILANTLMYDSVNNVWGIREDDPILEYASSADYAWVDFGNGNEGRIAICRTTPDYTNSPIIRFDDTHDCKLCLTLNADGTFGTISVQDNAVPLSYSLCSVYAVNVEPYFKTFEERLSEKADRNENSIDLTNMFLVLNTLVHDNTSEDWTEVVKFDLYFPISVTEEFLQSNWFWAINTYRESMSTLLLSSYPYLIHYGNDTYYIDTNGSGPICEATGTLSSDGKILTLVPTTVIHD